MLYSNSYTKVSLCLTALFTLLFLIQPAYSQLSVIPISDSNSPQPFQPSTAFLNGKYYTVFRTQTDLFLQIVDSSGNRAGNNIKLMAAASGIKNPKIVAGEDSLLVLWEEGSPEDVSAAIIGLTGNNIITRTAIITAAGRQYAPSAAYNNKRKEFLVIWSDERDGGSVKRVIIGNSGIVKTESNVAFTGTGNFGYPQAVFDGTHYLIAYASSGNTLVNTIFWKDDGSQADGPVMVVNPAYFVSSAPIFANPLSDVGQNFVLVTDNGVIPALAYNPVSGNYLVFWSSLNSRTFDVDIFYAELAKIQTVVSLPSSTINQFKPAFVNQSKNRVALTNAQGDDFLSGVAFNPNTRKAMALLEKSNGDVFPTPVDTITNAVPLVTYSAKVPTLQNFASAITFDNSTNKFFFAYESSAQGIVGRMLDGNGNPLSGGLLTLPQDTVTRQLKILDATGRTFTGQIANNTQSFANFPISFTHPTLPSAVVVDLVFVDQAGGRNVDLSGLKIQIEDKAVSADFSGVADKTSIGATHSIIIKDSNNGQGVFVCLGAKTIQETTSACPNKLEFKGPFPESKGGVAVARNPAGQTYTVSGLVSTGVGLISNIRASALSISHNNLTDTAFEFLASYMDASATPNAAIQGATCSASFSGGISGNSAMAFNSTKSLYSVNRDKQTKETTAYTITCSHPDFDQQTKTSAITGTQIPATTNNPPSVTLSSPVSGEKITQPSVTFSCSATDDNAVAELSLYSTVSGSKKDEKTEKPNTSSASLSYKIDNIKPGSYSWGCSATDISGKKSPAADSTFTVEVSSCNADSDCTQWSDCGSDNFKYRKCLNAQTCNHKERESCIPQAPVCIEDWRASGFTKCVDGKQAELLKDENGCGTTENKPDPKTKSCKTEESFPFTTIILVVAIIAVAVVGIIFYQKHKINKIYEEEEYAPESGEGGEEGGEAGYGEGEYPPESGESGESEEDQEK